MTVMMSENRWAPFPAACIILAGGRNSRMNGTDKAKLIIDTQPLLQYKYNLFRNWFEEVIVVCDRKRQNDYPGMNVVVDEQEGQGPLMGLYSGLRASRHPINFATACDYAFYSGRCSSIAYATYTRTGCGRTQTERFLGTPPGSVSPKSASRDTTSSYTQTS